MADFQNHINQANENLQFLIDVCNTFPERWDWKVTLSFYTAVHIANAHLARTVNMHYRTHERVKNELYSSNSAAHVPPQVYLAYTKLEGLSRRARYLCHHKPANHSPATHLTYVIHFERALQYLDTFLTFFIALYGLNLPTLDIKCPQLRGRAFSSIKIVV